MRPYGLPSSFPSPLFSQSRFFLPPPSLIPFLCLSSALSFLLLPSGFSLHPRATSHLHSLSSLFHFSLSTLSLLQSSSFHPNSSLPPSSILSPPSSYLSAYILSKVSHLFYLTHEPLDLNTKIFRNQFGVLLE